MCVCVCVLAIGKCAMHMIFHVHVATCICTHVRSDCGRVKG